MSGCLRKIKIYRSSFLSLRSSFTATAWLLKGNTLTRQRQIASMILTNLAGAVAKPVMHFTRYGLSDDGLSDQMKSFLVI